MLKKFIAIVLSLVLAFSLTAVCTASAEETEPTAQTDKGAGTYIYLHPKGGELWLRAKPDDESELLFFIYDKQLVNITEVKDGYGKTTCKGVEGDIVGWVSMEYLFDPDEVDPLRLVCLTEVTYQQIKAMTESDKLKLCISLKEPVFGNGSGYISCAELGLSAEEFEQMKMDIYTSYDLACDAFIKDYSLQKATLAHLTPEFTCKVTLEDINKMLKDERVKSFMFWEYWKNENDDEKSEEGYGTYVAYSPWKDEDTVLHSHPIISSGVRDHIPDGTVLEITEFCNGFGRTTYNGKDGWILGGYILPYEPATDVDEYYTVPTFSYDGYLDLRGKPSVSYTVGSIPSGTLLHITQTANGYGKTVYNGKEGWVLMDVLLHPEAYAYTQSSTVYPDELFADTDAEDWVACWDNEVVASIRGDANEDGNLDMLDVTVTQKSIAKYDTHCNALLADMDENSVVDLQDVVQMQKTIADII